VSKNDRVPDSRDTAIYFAHLSDDHEGYIRFFRRLLWTVGTLAAAALLATAIILITAWSAQ